MYTKAILTAAVLALAGVASTPSDASRSTCKDVYVEAQNKTGKMIKVIDMHYKIAGYGKKSEPVKNARVPGNRPFTLTRNFEQSAGRNLRVEVLYRVARKKVLGKTIWSRTRRGYSAYAICNDDQVYTLHLREKLSRPRRTSQSRHGLAEYSA